MAGMFAPRRWRRYRHRVDRTTGSLGKRRNRRWNRIHHIEQSLPFPLLGFDSDNGSEFLNYHLLRHFTERKKPIQFTRSRALVKKPIMPTSNKKTGPMSASGWDMTAWTTPVVPLLNDLYTQEWRLFHNFFLPSVKLLAKDRIASKTIRRYDPPKRPTSGSWNPPW